MGFWDVVYHTGDLVNQITVPGMSTVKRAVSGYTSAVVTKVVGIQKLHDPDNQKIAQIGQFTTTLAKNAGKYALYEGYKHIPGATVASKLISDTMREVEQKKHKESSTQKSELTSQDAVKDGSAKPKIPRSRM